MPDGYNAATVNTNTNLKPVVHINGRTTVAAGPDKRHTTAGVKKTDAVQQPALQNINQAQTKVIVIYPTAVAVYETPVTAKAKTDSFQHISIKQKQEADQIMVRKVRKDSLADVRTAAEHQQELRDAVLEYRQPPANTSARTLLNGPGVGKKMSLHNRLPKKL